MPSRRVPALLLALWVGLPQPAPAGLCAAPKAEAVQGRLPSTGRIHALALFGRFADQADPGPPAYADHLFDADLPGSLTHFYLEMSQGQFRLDGAVVPHWYASRRPAAAYLAQPGQVGLYGRIGDFTREILDAADLDLDLGQYDDDGPDGVPNSGDDDGYVDFVFLDLLAVPYGFIVGPATGISLLGLSGDYLTRDAAAGGGYIRVRNDENPGGIGGVVQQGRNFSEAAASMAHEFGHALGLPDLFDKDFLRREASDPEPEQDSAGLGYWCLMAHGARGWADRGGPNPFGAWALERLGWIGVGNQNLVVVEGEVKDAYLSEVQGGGKVFKLPTRDPAAYFLVQYRQPGTSYYERDLPGSGLLIWQVQPGSDNDHEERKLVDLVCADGNYADAGYAQGGVPAPAGPGDNLDFWAHDPGYTAAHSGNLGDATDLYEGERFTEFSPRTNPAAPAGNSVSRIRRVAGGMLADLSARDRRWAGEIKGEVVWRDTVEMVGDVVVPERSLLRVLPGTVVLVSTGPEVQRVLGSDRQRVELIVRGGLRAGGRPGLPVRFTSAAAHPAPGDWRGITVEGSGTAYLENAEIEYPYDGVSGRGLRSGQDLVELGVRHAERYGIYFAEQNVPLRLTQVSLEHSGRAGGRVEGGGSVVVEESAFVGNAAGGYEQVQGMLDCRVCRFADNGLVAGSNLSIAGLTRGALIGNHFSGGVGVYCAGAGALSIEQNSFDRCRIGVISADATPRIARNEFLDNGLALQVQGGRLPVRVELNAVQAGLGLLENNTGSALVAANNWWGEADEVSIGARMRGVVDWRPILHSDPRTLPAALTLGPNYPNPFNGNTVIPFAVGVDEAVRAQGKDMALVVRNAAGQVVRRLWRAPAQPGGFQIVWDGADEAGLPVASGAYYCQVEVGDLHLARPMLLLR